MKTLQLTDIPLAGRNLIEASAGTGKTHAIAGLFLRLVVEKRVPVNQILAVTFTESATAELKERVRQKLIQAKEAFLRGASDEPLINTLVKRHHQPHIAVRRLAEALNDFDRAAIYTIHGFCQKILQENSFETGSLFDAELITDQFSLLQEVADDFWRTHFYQAPLELIRHVLRKIDGPGGFLKLLGGAGSGDIRIVPRMGRPAFQNLDPFRNLLKQFKKRWSACRAEIEKCLKAPSLNGKIYGSLNPDKNQHGLTRRDEKVFLITRALNRFVDDDNIGFPLFKEFEYITASKISRSTKKNHPPPSHAFFQVCEELFEEAAQLKAEMDRYLIFLKAAFFSFSKSALVSKKRVRNVLFFDDLITSVQRALEGRGGNRLITAIRNQYKAALVDEFQDTDPNQYQIFFKLFSSEKGVLFMIGDPKQAIYGFRGADIFSYMDAAAHADTTYTLTENWRSAPGLIEAVNTLFSNAKTPFVFKEISFVKGRSAKTAEPHRSGPDPPLTLWFLKSETDLPINKKEAVQRIAAAVCDKISRLTANDTASIRAADIAVLVRTNRQAQMMKTRLSAKGIPSVLLSAENVFDSRESKEIQQVLAGIADPTNERRFKAAAVTHLIGLKANDLESLDEMSSQWRHLRFHFREYCEMWQRHGFIRMFRLLMIKEKIRPRLLSYPDGERRLTNVMHLAEILHRESSRSHKGIEALIKWLSEQRDPTTPRLEEHQLRLESDENAVQIITTHKSKGLEYPVVFYPFGWEGSLIREKEIFFHDPDAKRRPTLDLDPDTVGRSRILAQNERLAENLRLLYVALTRAKERCYLAWGRIRGAETSAMAYLFHLHGNRFGATDQKDLIARLKERLTGKTEEDLLIDLKDLKERSNGTIEVVTDMAGDTGRVLPQRDEDLRLVKKIFSRTIKTEWKISSYSSLVSQPGPQADLPDHDSDRLPYDRFQADLDDDPGQDRQNMDEPMDIFSFPKGSKAGIFFHDILEKIDFSGRPADHERLITEKLKEYGFESKWQEIVCRQIKQVLLTPLSTGGKTWTLSSIPRTERINEMEFHFPLNTISPKTLMDLFAEYGHGDRSLDFPNRLEKLTFSPAEGFMKGYVDMIFRHDGRYYLLDWKSNLLGIHPADYHKDSVQKVMNDDLYILQYHLYVLALHQHLCLRLPNYSYETDFGGVFYVFIRGVDPDHDGESGIYHDRPTAVLIQALGKTLIPSFKADRVNPRAQKQRSSTA